MPSVEVDLWRDIWLARRGDTEARERVEQSARENWPGSTWGPLDDLPVGTRVRLPRSMGGESGVVIGLYMAIPEAWPNLHTCPNCACARPVPQAAGWWAIRRDGDPSRTPIAGYPPCLTREES